MSKRLELGYTVKIDQLTPQTKRPKYLRNLEQDIRHEEDDQRIVILVTLELQLGRETKHVCVCNVDLEVRSKHVNSCSSLFPSFSRLEHTDPVKKGEQVEDAQKGNDAEVNLAHELLLRRVRGARHDHVVVHGAVDIALDGIAFFGVGGGGR